MFFEVGASQVGAKIGPKIDFGGLWTPLCNTLDCFCLDVISVIFNRGSEETRNPSHPDKWR